MVVEVASDSPLKHDISSSIFLVYNQFCIHTAMFNITVI
jgi:hypothetical protein